MVPALDDIERALIDAHVDELRIGWQCRALQHAWKRNNPRLALVLLSALADTYDNAMPSILHAAFPGFTSIEPPFLVSSAKINKSGHVVADLLWEDGRIEKDATLYGHQGLLRDDVRELADRLKLNDRDRVEMFKCVQRWVVADRRLDPTMDPADPDAKRLVH